VAEISIADLILIIISAFGGAWANSWYRSWEAKKAEDRELRGLLILIDWEILNNNKRLHDDEGDEISLFGVLAIDGLRTESWDRSAARLTQLLSPLHVYALSAYYSHIAEIQPAIESPVTPREEWVEAMLAEQGSQALELGNAARWLINHEYIKETDRVLPVPEPPGHTAIDEGAATDREQTR
jgi:hypothetical protein